MNWKQEAIDKLKCYAAKKNSIEQTVVEIHRLEDDTTRIRSAVSDSTPVTGGGSTREDMLINNIVRRDELRLARKEAIRWVKVVDSALAVLDEEEKMILDLFYIHRAKGNVDRLCGALSVEKTRVYERKDAALRHFTFAMYGVVET